MGCLLQDPYHVTIAAFHPRRQVEQSWSEILEIDFFDIFLRFVTENAAKWPKQTYS